MRKTDPRAKLKTLDEQIQDALWTWLCEDTTRTLKDAVTWIYSEHDIRTDFRRLSEWRAWYQRKLEIQEAESEASEIKEALKHTNKYSAKQLEELGNVIFLNRATKTGDAKTFTAVAQVVQGRDRMEGEQQAHKDKMALAQTKISIDREKLKQTEVRLKQNEVRLAQAQETIDLQKRKIEALEAEAAALKAAQDAALQRVKDGGASEETIAIVREAMGMKL